MRGVSVVVYRQSWDDDYLVWNPDDYDGVNRLTLPPTQIWRPDIGIDNRYAQTEVSFDWPSIKTTKVLR